MRSMKASSISSTGPGERCRAHHPDSACSSHQGQLSLRPEEREASVGARAKANGTSADIEEPRIMKFGD